ncbi:ATP-grasp domain-containing protein [Teredinibacter turnerae]|uniref:ATP-grasp domain-containing protein n=1 Tax=Teredinibacter turnerae TaxID=2426 RepID=UPI0012F9A5C7|nr:ATP-grasp domain-containing protein [Teredinibacter turnerae]
MENGQDIWLSEYFENHAVAYTGSQKNVIMFDSDKVLAKRHLQKKGISTALFFTAQENEFRRDDDLPLKYPLFLKPISAANSNGVDNDSYVSSFTDFERKVSAIKNTFNQATLVEEYMGGAEYTVAMLTTKSGELLVSAVEVVPPRSNERRQILCKDTKKENIEVLRKITDQQIHHEVRRIAFEVFIGIEAEGFARVDIKSNESGKCFFMEVNLVPGMTLGSSYFPEAFRVDSELSYDQVVSHIIDYCLSKDIKAMQYTADFYFEYGQD